VILRDAGRSVTSRGLTCSWGSHRRESRDAETPDTERPGGGHPVRVVGGNLGGWKIGRL